MRYKTTESIVKLVNGDTIKIYLTPLGRDKFYKALEDKDRFYYLQAELGINLKCYIDLNLDNILYVI